MEMSKSSEAPVTEAEEEEKTTEMVREKEAFSK